MKKTGAYQRERKGYLNSMDYMRKRTGRHIVLLNIFAVFVIIYAVFGTVHMKTEDVRITRNYVKNYTEQIEDMIDMDIYNIMSNIESLVEALEKEHIKIGWEEFLNSKRSVYMIDFMAISDRNGKLLSVSGDTENKEKSLNILREQKHFREALDRGECAVGIDNNFIFFARNIYQDGKKTGVFWAGDREDKLRNIFVTRTFQKETSASFIMNEDGKVLLASNSENQGKCLTDFLPESREVQRNIQIMNENIEQEKNGTFSYISDKNRTYYFTYAVTEINDWVTVTIMPADLFTGFSDDYVKMMLGCIVAVFIIFLSFFVLLYRSYFQNGKKLEQLAFRDEVTGGINRTELRMRFQEICRERKAEQYTLILLDCVDFKIINASLGDKTGDKMLRYFYTVLTSFLNSEELVARTEMDHFFILMKEKNPDVIQIRINQMIEKIRLFENTRLPRCDVSFWIGICPVENSYTDLSVLQDNVIAVVKNQTYQDIGKQIYFDKKLSDKIQRERELDLLFEESLLRGDFQVYFQPKVNIISGNISGAEALVRWKLPEKGLISPAEFIPLLEGNGKICILDRYVFGRVCKTLKEWKEQGRVLYPVSVNLSRSHFIDDNFWMEFVKIADRYQVDHSLLEFEVTETLFTDASQTMKVRDGLRMIHENGFKCSLDDFGIGYSSLTLLREFEIDVLKLDRSFFLDLNSTKARDVVISILDMAEKLDIRTVAEGIETDQQMDFIKNANCDTVQGFFFSRPMPIKEFERWSDEFCISDYMNC